MLLRKVAALQVLLLQQQQLLLVLVQLLLLVLWLTKVRWELSVEMLMDLLMLVLQLFVRGHHHPTRQWRMGRRTMKGRDCIMMHSWSRRFRIRLSLENRASRVIGTSWRRCNELRRHVDWSWHWCFGALAGLSNTGGLWGVNPVRRRIVELGPFFQFTQIARLFDGGSFLQQILGFGLEVLPLVGNAARQLGKTDLSVRFSMLAFGAARVLFQFASLNGNALDIFRRERLFGVDPSNLRGKETPKQGEKPTRRVDFMSLCSAFTSG
jgi:hypothetical protein